MKAVWIHTFPPQVRDAGSFMYPLARGVEQHGVDVAWAAVGRVETPWAMYRAARRVTGLGGDIDVVHAQYGSGCGFVTGMSRLPKVLTLRGSDWYGNGPVQGVLSKGHSNLGRLLSRRAARRFDVVVCMSERMAAEVERVAPGQQVWVIPDPIDLELFTPKPRAEARERIGAGGDRRPWVLFASFGGVRAVKRPELARAAVAELHRRGLDVHLHSVSGVPKSEMPYHLSACNVVLLTSTHEGWPNIVKEGLACEVPFVSTDVSDLRALAARTENCYVVGDEVESIVEAVARAIEPRSEGHLRELVTWMNVDNLALRLIECYDIAIARHRS